MQIHRILTKLCHLKLVAPVIMPHRVDNGAFAFKRKHWKYFLRFNADDYSRKIGTFCTE